jgi:hypothetical protein
MLPFPELWAFTAAEAEQIASAFIELTLETGESIFPVIPIYTGGPHVLPALRKAWLEHPGAEPRARIH